MKKYLQVLRLTAKLLLAAIPAILVTGFLTAKPGLIDASALGSFRWWHTRLVPVLLVPLLLAHSLAGVLFMISRNKRFDRPLVRRGLWGLWGLLALTLLYLYLWEPKAGAPLLTPTGSLEAAGGATASSSAAGGQGGAAGQGGRAGQGGVGGVEPPASSGGSPTASTTARPVAVSHAPAPSTAVKPTPKPAPTAAVGPTPTPSPTSPTGPQLIQSRCTVCHGLDIVVAKKHTAAEWGAIVDRMIGHGAVLNPEERRLVLRYLPRP